MNKKIISKTNCHRYTLTCVSLFTAYANEFKEAMVFQCTGEGFITGVESYHDNRYEDRRFKFQCCQSPRESSA